MTDLGDLLGLAADGGPCPCGFYSAEACAMARTVPGVCRVPTLPTLAELPPAAPCESCGCCVADLCAAAVAEGTACLMLAAPRPDRAAAERVLECPCAPVVCTCTPPAHVRGIARCEHGRRARQAAADAAQEVKP